MANDQAESPHSKTESIAEELTTSKSNTTNTTPTSTQSKKGIDPLQAQADRLKLFTDPLGRRRPSIPPTPTATPNFPITTPVSPFKPSNDFMTDDPFSSERTIDNNPFSPPIDSSQLNLFVGTTDTGSRSRTGSVPSTRSIPGTGSVSGTRSMSVSASATSSRRVSQADRRMSKEWDASKVPPSRFQRPEGSIFATPGSRDGHVEKNNIQQRYKDKLKEKGWDK